MFTVSLIGPDGVGKTSVAKGLEGSLPLPVKYIYMGLNNEAANLTLPTTRLRDAILSRKSSKSRSPRFCAKSRATGSQYPKDTGLFRKAVRFARKTLGLTNLILEEWYRQFIAYVYKKFGYIVIFDRHFIYDFYDFNHNTDKRTITNKIHDIIRNKTMSAPDLVICLDAPGEVAFKRKGEFNIEDLEMRRRQYLSLRTVVKNFVIIDANRSLNLVIKETGDTIKQYYASIQ